MYFHLQILSFNEENMATEYELMKILHVEKSYPQIDGIDSCSETVGDALMIIKYLLKWDDSVYGKYKLVKIKKKK